MHNSIRVAGIVASVLLVGTVAPVAAQSKGVDVTVGYQFQRLSCSGCDAENIPAGFSADVAGPINAMWSWVGQVDWGRKSTTFGSFDQTNTLTFFGGGARWSQMQASDMNPFVQVLVGGTRDNFDNGSSSSSVTKFTFDVDGGVAVPISSDKKTSFVGQIGYRRIAEDTALNGIRLVLGIRFNVGGE